MAEFTLACLQQLKVKGKEALYILELCSALGVDICIFGKIKDEIPLEGAL